MRTRLAAAVGLSLASLSGTALGQVDVHRATEPPARFDGQKAVRVHIRNTRDLRTALALTDDVWTESIRPGGPVDIRVTREQFAALVASGIPYTVMVDDLQASIDAESALIRALGNADDQQWYTNYHNYADNKAYCQALAAQYPSLCTYQVIGQSLQGREIFALRITGPGSPASRPASLWFGGQHAREWINVPVPEYHAEQLLVRYATDPQVRALVDNQEFIFVPIMNPDGYDYTWTNDRYWRKNRRANSGTGCSGTFGIDLNRNWGYQWGSLPTGGSSGQCSSETYRGPSAFSEPETQVMRDFVIANPRVALLMDWHSYAQLVMSPWGYTSSPVTPPSMATLYQNLDDQMAAAIQAVNGRVYDAGPVFSTIYPANGVSVDWAWGARGVKGFTIELPGTDFVFPPAQITGVCQETWAAFLVLANHLQPCYANCDGSTIAPALNVNDFLCFQNRFNSADTWANCDGSTTPPVLNINDFICFTQKYSAGCP